MQRVFISYSSADAQVARAVADACETLGAVVFLDERSLHPAGDWYEAVRANIASADIVFVLVSTTALASRYVNQEIGIARQAGAKVVPLLLVPAEGLPPEIGSLHGASIVGLHGQELDTRVANLLAGSERATIELPQPLRKKLDVQDARSASAFTAMLPAMLGGPTVGAPFLLPDLREHGPRHVERVLRLVAWILDDASMERMSPRDVFVLVTAVVVRERVLYVPLSALVAMIRRAALPPGALADDVPVRRLWQDFVQRGRFEADKGFGSGVDHRALLDLTLADRGMANDVLLPWVSRFLRRHHGRLAHEAAAVPPDDFALPRTLSDHLSGRLGALVPLLARAGDEELREVIRCFATNAMRPPRLIDGAVPVVLAAALRCAIQLDRFVEVSDGGLSPKPADLAPDPESDSALQSLDEIRYDPLTDAFALQVLASPGSAFAYQAVLEWTLRLQSRLDESWAVIGEVYGTDRFGLRLRTASTPLAQPARLGLNRSLPYVPQLARITTASAELIRLLTAPLYGNRPEVGVRELLQNALDAVRERAHWPPAEDPTTNPCLDAYGCDVLVRLLPPSGEDAGGWIEVVDRGVGMTPETVRDYFLRVGASLRRDSDWLQRFPTSKQVELLRSGKFGIGTLASFLLGEEVHITTRHVTEGDGVGTHFVARLSDAPIELQRASAPEGTSIRIPISRTVYEALASQPERWDWFALTRPRVIRVIADEVVVPVVAESDEDLERMPWRRLEFDGLERVLWRPGEGARQRLWCNGLLVEHRHETISDRRYTTGGPGVLDTADVMVFDSRGVLPLAVSREHLEGHAPYHDALLRDFLLDHCAWLLARAGLAPAAEIPKAPMWEHFEFMSPGDGMTTAPPYMEVEGGLLPWTMMNIAESDVRMVVACDGSPSNAPIPPEPSRGYALVQLKPFGGFGGESFSSVATRHLRDFVRAVVPATSVDVMTQLEDDRAAFKVVGECGGITWRSNDTRIDAAVAEPLLPLATALAHRHGAKVVAFAAVDPAIKLRPNALTEIWKELDLPALISRDPEARGRSCMQALEVIGDRVRLHDEAMRAASRT